MQAKEVETGRVRFHILKALMLRLKALMVKMAPTTDIQSVDMTGSTGAIQMRARHMVSPSRSGSYTNVGAETPLAA